MHSSFASWHKGIIDKEITGHLDSKPVSLNSWAMASIHNKFSAMIEGNALCGSRVLSTFPYEGPALFF